ncbi:MAG: alanyl-tRNA editing protein [candidate division Zixibacteria bacterium]|nr:alanyl-tRNA editing protein [candidate division Zixibacteria bacterium]MDH3935812.1 alanyl-tRNA editing protein [candidate division Zixibacteria bacterium]MDH4035487.1 alanyl-tRNA editing protein [candidate division Zixibacteria bacterium]
MTERLYYHDSGLLTFQATIVGSRDEDGRSVTVLDRSAFYPTSGGQQFDTGRLNDCDIIDVSETEDGQVRHYSVQRVGEVGDEVAGLVDRDRRRRHCCLHTGQHILSHVSMQLYELKTVSVHLGDEYGAVELDGGSLSPEDIIRLELRANEIVGRAHPVEIIFAEGDELAALPLRKPPKRSGRIRVINIGDFEYSACGGTHCANSSEIGVVKIIGVEKIRGHVLIKFLVGVQAFDDYCARFEVTSELARKFTCHYKDLPEKIESLTGQQKELKQELVGLYKEILPIRADKLAAPVIAKEGRLLGAESDLPGARLMSQLAQLIAERIHGVALLSRENRLVLAVAEESPFDARKLAAQLSERFGVKGGGNRLLAQVGGAESTMLREYEMFVKGLIEE